MGQSFPGKLLVEVSESKIKELFIFLHIKDNATIFIWQGIALPGLFSLQIASLRENPLKICKAVRNEEPTMRSWERQWNCVRQCETMRVERSVSIWPGRITRVERFDWMGFGVKDIQKCKQISAEKLFYMFLNFEMKH